MSTQNWKVIAGTIIVTDSEVETLIAIVPESDGTCATPSHEETRANAIKIAATPKLLKALIGILPLAECGSEQSECGCGPEDHADILNEARAAISEAERKAP